MLQLAEACWETFRSALNKALAENGVSIAPPKRVAQKSNPAQAAHTSAKQDTGTSVAFVPFDKNGDPIEPCKIALLSQGFRPGTRVISTEGVQKTIVALKGDGSTEIDDGTTKEWISYTEFLANYEINTIADVSWLDLDAQDLQEDSDYNAAIQKHAIILAIQAAFETHPLPAGSLAVVRKPRPSAQARKTFKPKQLKLVPVCYTVKLAMAATSTFQCVFKDDSGTYVYDVVKPGAAKAVVPTFFVARADNEDDANMELTTFKALVSTGSKTRQYQVDVTMLQNNVELDDGTELLLPPLSKNGNDAAKASSKRKCRILLDPDDNASAKTSKLTW